RYLLKMIEGNAAPSVALKHRWMLLQVRPGTDAKKKQANRGGMVSLAAQERRAAIDRQVGAADGGEGRAVLCAADENQMGKLQPRRTQYPPQHGAGQEATGVPRIYRRARNDPRTGADAQRPLRLDDEPIHAAMEVLSGPIKSV